ncbi:hypothetical protein HBH56_157770 [Parastagonospora nodorum]|uniref:Uncharacterized protein n=2 Tax=Phaeosphaeria nodorum (strain SN15 / ATCC MYA-4574 / FGSC 10173) TaxID=321614 RepID=A0A7U2F2Y7_PHANO|nr:hypothetical protein SNOG_08781 [Parastagonospora nodorum SN15]KAH3909534.1 hypothetical protein HBH56_157770 [Parastagonospora nodorum]EAT83949.2 hypothetical protein SNOG_08781 [Parastagonospora nodorum SN15]KAH3922944.1 hypothetical protein HBH54_216970 [Parastagonospora nodorum]KAH3973412.1 hypothetical protein HBH51_097340 [Parastagonospora nodorum]KAH4002686.1 hypothetical protein HBI10_073680 [Parastagonospora nodorum]
MCYHNYTSHNGCGHLGESHKQPWTLCPKAIARLNEHRGGPSSPPLSPPATDAFAAPPKRSSSVRGFFSLSRSNTTASRRTISGSSIGTARDSSSSNGSYTYAPSVELNYANLPDHQLAAAKCAQPIKRTHVSREMDVCKICKRWISDMRSMIIRYDKTGSIRGTVAFDKFLKPEGDGLGEQEDDVTIPLDDRDDHGHVLGARQAIVMGHPAGMLDGDGGLLALEKELNAQKGFY